MSRSTCSARAGVEGPVLGDRLLERAARDELHNERDAPVREVPDRVDADDVRVLELRHRARLARQAGDGFLVGGEARPHDLHRDFATEVAVARAEDHGHAAPTQFADQLVVGIELRRPQVEWHGVLGGSRLLRQRSFDVVIGHAASAVSSRSARVEHELHRAHLEAVAVLQRDAVAMVGQRRPRSA